MRTDGIKVRITTPIPFDKPDGNGVIHSKDAVGEITRQSYKNYPIIFRGTEDDNAKIIGHIADDFLSANWDNKNGVCNLTVNGVVYHGGMDIIVNECHRDENGVTVIDDFRIAGIGFSL